MHNKWLPFMKGLPVVAALFALASSAFAAAAHAAVFTVAAAEGGAPPEGGGGGGLLSVDIVSAIWVLIIFVLLVAILYKTAWKNVLAGLKAREERIRGDIQSAEQARAKAETSLSEYSARLADAEAKVAELLAKAAADAEKIGANIRAQAQADGLAERDKAKNEIEHAKRDALREVYEQTADLATTVASKIIRRNLNSQDQLDLVNETLNQFQALESK